MSIGTNVATDREVLHVVGSLEPSTGGPSYSVPSLCGSLAGAGWRVTLCTTHDPSAGPVTLPAAGPGKAAVRLVSVARWPHVIRGITPARGFRAALLDAGARARLIHSHGVWLWPINPATAALARQLGIPHVIAPRGMLDGWSLKQKVWKKAVAWWAYQRRDLREAACLHVTSEMELGHCRALGLKNPVAVIPNGVDVPAACDPAQARREAVRRWPGLANRRILLFLSRIHPKKGLLHLAGAWGSLCREFGDWTLVFAGYDEGGHRAEVEAACRAAGLGPSQVLWTGPVAGEAKAALLGAADLFVLPSHTENFGIVVAEALAYGCPVIATTGTPWRPLAERGCGWWIEVGRDPLEAALREALNLGEAERREKGARGRAWVLQDYSWDKIGRDMASVYAWLLGEGVRPAMVYEH